MKVLAQAILCGVATIGALGGAADAKAQNMRLVAPHLQPVQPVVPKLGFASYHDGHGEHVTSVFYGSRAARIGLEPGDVIVALNGTHLCYPGAWNQAMARATAQGHVTLAIRDWRTGGIAYRHIDLGWGGPPVVHHHHGPERHTNRPTSRQY